MIILRNAIQTPDGTILESFHRHDYVSHTDANGHYYAVDGGKDYFRRSGSTNEAGYKDLSVAVDEDGPYDHQVVREALSWGSRGVNGDQPLTHIRLKDMETSHIQAVLRTQDHMLDFYRKAMEMELEWRQEDPS